MKSLFLKKNFSFILLLVILLFLRFYTNVPVSRKFIMADQLVTFKMPLIAKDYTEFNDDGTVVRYSIINGRVTTIDYWNKEGVLDQRIYIRYHGSEWERRSSTFFGEGSVNPVRETGIIYGHENEF